MSTKRTQNHIAQSRTALPVAFTYAALTWAVIISHTSSAMIAGALTLVAALVLMTLNARHALIPFYSRSVSCTFLVLSTLAATMSLSQTGAIVGLCFSVFYLLVFYAYQAKQSPGTVYFAYIFLGIASLWFIQVLYLLPVLWIAMQTLLMNMSSRTFFASLLGIITPYWFLLGYQVYVGELAAFLAHFVEIIHFKAPLDFSAFTFSQFVALGIITVLGCVGIAHFSLTSYTDKIRTRMFYECFATLFVATLVFIILQPRLFPALFAILVVNASPLFARFFTISHSRASNVTFLVALCATVIYTFASLWMLLTNS